MSSERGNAARKRAQKYKNKTVFRNDLYDKTPQQKRINNLHVSEVCAHCKGVIEWKIKYKKYKPLTQPKTCTRCSQRNVLKAYHVLCKDCARSSRCCAKCLKSADEVELEPPEPTPEEQTKLKVEMQRLIKSLPERKRRSFLRYMERGQEIKSDQGDEENSPLEPKRRVPHSRDDLLAKIEQLKVIEEDDDESYSSSDDSDECCSDESEAEEENEINA